MNGRGGSLARADGQQDFLTQRVLELVEIERRLTFVAQDFEDGRLVGILHVEASRHGFGEIGMLVHRDWRGRGVGSALLREAISRAREAGLHKLCLEVFAHNTAAIALYRRCGFAEEGRRAGQYRRASGELWDSIIMGLPL